MSDNEIVIVSQVSKSFGHGHQKVDAVRDISLSVHRGEILGIVGPDGAGKTTLVKMLCTVTRPDRGTIQILDFDVASRRDSIRREIGYLSQRFSLYGDLTVSENIDFFADIHGMSAYIPRKQELLMLMRLDRFADRLADKLSGGMKQKLALACTLIHRPRIIFLDEPTTGVDPVSRRDFWWILSRLHQEGLTIIISTPYLDEAERCHRVALMDRGEILLCDTPAVIRGGITDKMLEVTCSPVRVAKQLMIGHPGIVDVQSFGDRIHVKFSPPFSVESLRSSLEAASVKVIDIREVHPSLEDAFIHLLGDR